ncbi:MAG: CPBP family intramembrane metalloprotease [Clostridia bacterium]|nr:CPBP family intramembrane metalloprotease [Clostridia bacterium]
MDKKNPALSVLIAVLKAFGFFAIWFAMQTAVSMIFTIIYTLTHQGLSEEAIIEAVTSLAMEMTLLANALTLICFILIYKLRGRSLFEKIESNKIAPRNYIQSLLLGVSAMFTVSLIIASIPFPEDWLKALNDNNEIILNASGFIMFLTTVVCAPILEEILFRGLMLRTLKDVMPPWLAILISAVAFGLAHANPIGIIYASIFGAVLGWAYIKFNSIIPCIIIHAAYNGTNLLVTDGVPFFVVYASVILLVMVIIDIQKTTRGEE